MNDPTDEPIVRVVTDAIVETTGGSAHVAATRAFIEEMADRLHLDGSA